MKDRIKKVREESKLTQTAFGEKIGVSQNYVWMLETGQRTPGDRTIRDICREFGVNEMWLRDGIGEPYASKTREAELGEYMNSLFSESPESFRNALLTTLLKFDPNGPEWPILERIYENVAAKYKPPDTGQQEPEK